MSAGLLYNINERYKNKFIVDHERGEVINVETGEVIEDHLPIDIPTIRASDYAEWESKRQHEVLISEKDKRLYSAVWSVGEKIGAPKWIRQDVFNFIKSISKSKARFVLGILGRNTSFSIFNEKFILAVFYVITKKRGLVGLAEAIGKMKCDGDTPCYMSRRLKDKEFHRYKSIVMKLWFLLYRDTNYIDEIRNYIKYFANVIRNIDDGIDIIKVVNRAIEMLSRYRSVGSFKPRNFGAALVIASITNIYGEEKANDILRKLVKVHKINVSSVRSIIKRLKNGDS